MMMRIPTNRQLTYLATLAQTGSFRKAAEQLGLSQPALTQQIQSLEQTIGALLIDRRHGSVLLTPSGHAFVEDARKVLEQITASAHRARAISTGMAGSLRIGMTDDYFYSPLAGQIIAFIEQHPELEIETKSDLSNVLVRQLSEQALDIVFVNRPLMASLGPFRAIDLPPSRIMLVVKSNHALAARKTVTTSHLGGLKLILPPQNGSVPFFLQCQRLIEELEVMPEIVHRTSSSILALEMVRGGFEAALLSEYSCDASSFGLAAIPINHPDAALRHVLLMPRDSNSSVANLLIVALTSSANA